MIPNLVAGQILAGKYRLARVIRRGGMGTVLLAHHEVLDQRVAVKILDYQLTENPEIVARFVREARAAAKLESDHVVRVTDVGTLDGVGPYLVMEYLDGTDLSGLLADAGPLAVEEAVDYLLEAIDALAEAHSLGIVHRDIKPSNLFVARRADGSRVLKVLDFGVSKMRDGDASGEQGLTSARAVLGSPSYMSPEQLRCSKDVDPRTDIWSLGVVLYELLTGTRPFDGSSLVELARNVWEGSPKPLRGILPDLPPPLENAIMRCLQRDPSGRFATVADLGLAIAPFGTGRAKKEIDRALSLYRRRLPSLVDLESVTGGERTEVMAGPMTGGSSPGMVRVSTAGMGALPRPVTAGRGVVVQGPPSAPVSRRTTRERRLIVILAAALFACAVTLVICTLMLAGLR